MNSCVPRTASVYEISTINPMVKKLSGLNVTTAGLK
jgi:hypothetical protein